jgi:hypothetical protein
MELHRALARNIVAEGRRGITGMRGVKTRNMDGERRSTDD